MRQPTKPQRLFSYQFCICNADGTCQHMSKEHYDQMPKRQQKRYDKDKRWFKMAEDYYGPRGPLFCGAKPGVCCSDHCPRRFAPEAPGPHLTANPLPG